MKTDLECPICGRGMVTTKRVGGWSVDCKFMHPLVILENEVPCTYDYSYWNQKLYPTSRDAIAAHKKFRKYLDCIGSVGDEVV